MDSLTPSQRSAQMAKVRSKDTGPELFLRRLLTARGYRYRLHRNDLPGCPDVVFPSRRKAIFVHGCFWHRHGIRCPLTRLPKSRLEFWQPKLEKNRARDDKNRRRLRAAGWESLVVWECQLKKPEMVVSKLVAFLEKKSA